MYIPKEKLVEFRRICTNRFNGNFNQKKFDWLCNSYLYGNCPKDLVVENFIDCDFPQKAREISLAEKREKAMDYMIKNFSREERLLIMFQQDSEKFFSCFTAEKFKTESAREMIVGEFSQSFSFLKEKMKEFRWSKEFLAENGINFVGLKKLYFQIVCA